MKYIVIQLIILFWSVIFMYYLSSNYFFLPISAKGDLNWYNVGIVLTLVFLFVESLVSVGIFIIQKLWKRKIRREITYYSSLKWGIGLAFAVILMLLLNISHLFSLQWGLVILLIIIVFLILMK